MSERAELPDADPSALAIDEARQRILDALQPIEEIEQLSPADSYGRILASDLHAPMQVPPFRASAMDGYALRAHESDEVLKLIGKSLAGHPAADRIPAGCCVRITTGARVPDDADCVVQQENASVDGELVTILKQPASGLHVRPAGSDSSIGSLLLAAGVKLMAAEVAVLAAHGICQIPVKRKLKLAIFSTGDELCDAGSELHSGQIYDANRLLLGNLLQQPYIKLLDLGICPDTESAIAEFFDAAGDADALISTGGVSVGEADHVRKVLESRGRVALWKIAMKPGRPLTFGFHDGQRPYFGLPGNPVSAALTALLFVQPAVQRLSGETPQDMPELYLPLSSRLSKLAGRVEYQRGVMQRDHDGNWEVGTTGLQDSHVLTSLQQANCLIELPLASSGAEPGEQVRVHPFNFFRQSSL